MTRERIAVIGAGVAGLTASYVLRTRHDVELFDARGTLGGHADTHRVRTPDGASVPVDTGFIVHNTTTYPLLTRLFTELGVATQPCEMSMSVQCDECGLAYAGGKGGRGLMTAGPRGARLRFARLLAELPRFQRTARASAAGPDDGRTLGQVLAAGGHSRYFADHYALPLVATVWSAGETASPDHPAHHLFRFLANHGLLGVRGSLAWRTVVGGSREYVDRIAALLPRVHRGVPVQTVRRHADGADVVTADGTAHRFDRVVLATHADQALALLADPTAAEKQVLDSFAYSRNVMQLHTDPTLLPATPRARASWNHRKSSCRGGDHVVVSYDMNRLMRLAEPLDYVVTLNGADRVDASRVLAADIYEHPVYTPQTLAAQARLPELNSSRCVFAGAYHGWGFHEDGCASGVRAAAAFGVAW